MSKFITLLFLAALTATLGCRRQESPSTDSQAPVLVRLHFVGTSRLASDANAAKLRDIGRLPESERLAEQTLQRIAQCPRELYGERITPEQNERGAALVRPLLDDLRRQEWFLQVLGPAGPTSEWTLLVQLPADRLKLWRSNLTELMKVWGLGDLATNLVAGFPSWQIKRSEAPNVIRWIDAGSWLVLGVGQEKLRASDEAGKRIRSGGRPVPALTNQWLEAELDLPKLAGPLSLSPKITWPRTKLSLYGKGENLRTTVQVNFPEPVIGPLDPWQIPTNLISEPLNSFTAMRGVAPCLEKSDIVRKLELMPPPNQLYFWAQEKFAFQTFWAFPANDVTNTLIRVGERAPRLLSEDWQSRGRAQISWNSTNQQVFWDRLMGVTPYLRPARDVGREFVVGGLFPTLSLTNPFPSELLSQFSGRTNLLYYDWEITQTRLYQWWVTAQLFAVISEQGQLHTNTAGLPWLMKVGSLLGETVTEVTANAPREWTMVRKSHIGLTGIELVALIRWLENVHFPRLSFRLPPDHSVPPAMPTPK